MRERLTEILDSIKAFWERAGRRGRIIFFSCLAGALVMALALVLIFGRTDYVLLYNGLSVQEGASVLAILGEMGIEPNVSTTGAIYVPAADANRARMQVATNGFTGGNFTYDVYKEAGITSTQAEREQWYINQTQNRLQEMIQTFEEVQQAVVNISIPKPSVYALQPNNIPPSAAIKITKRYGSMLTPEQVQGIINIVRDTVAGLTEENISISDENGDMKAYIENQKNISGSKLNLTEQVNRSMTQKIVNMLLPVFGADNVQVAVNTVLDTDSRITEKEEYFPANEDDPQDNPLSRAVYEREKLGGENNTVGGVPGATDNTDVPYYAANEYNVSDGDSFAVRDELDFYVSSVREQIVKEGFEIVDMNVAVVVNATNMPDSQRDQIIDLVAAAAGLQNSKVSVQNMQFRGIPSVDLSPEEPDLTQYIIAGAVALAALMTILFMVIVNMRKKHREARLAAEAAALEEMRYYDGLGDEDGDQGEEFGPIPIQESQEQKLKTQIRDLAISDPEIVAQLLKTWLVTAD